MNPKKGANHTRSISFFINPRLPGDDHPVQRPVVTASVYYDKSAGTMFTVYKIDVQVHGERTHISVDAQNIEKVAVDYDVWCEFVAIGTPTEKIQSKRANATPPSQKVT